MQAAPQPVINMSKVEPVVLSILRKRKWSDGEIASMTPERAFREVCHWHGVMNIDAALAQASDSESFKTICLSNNVTTLGSTLFAVLTSLRGAVRTPSANVKRHALSA